MNFPIPPQIDAAQQQLLAAIQSVESKPLDPLAAPWPDIERSIIKLLGGAFDLERPEHQVVALGLAGFLGQRLNKELQAFWFPNREAVEGAVMGFPEALMVISPFGAVVDALRRAKLDSLDETLKDIRTSMARVKFSAAAMGQPRLSPVEYARLFDPGFVAFVAMDPTKAAMVWDSSPDRLRRELQEALSRASAKLPAEVRQQFEGQMVMALQRLDPSKPLKDQAEQGPRILELMAHLFGSVQGTAAAPEELWQDIVFPLLHIGAPAAFPPLDEEELEMAKKGVDPLFLFLDLVPYQQPAPEQGLLGEFAQDELSLPHPSLERAGSLRLIRLKADRIKGLLQSFDAQKTREAITRFQAHVAEKLGAPLAGGAEGPALLDTSLSLLAELKRVVEGNQELCMRRTTEAEAASEGAMSVVREALHGPRIILA